MATMNEYIIKRGANAVENYFKRNESLVTDYINSCISNHRAEHVMNFMVSSMGTLRRQINSVSQQYGFNSSKMKTLVATYIIVEDAAMEAEHVLRVRRIGADPAPPLSGPYVNHRIASMGLTTFVDDVCSERLLGIDSEWGDTLKDYCDDIEFVQAELRYIKRFVETDRECLVERLKHNPSPTEDDAAKKFFEYKTTLRKIEEAILSVSNFIAKEANDKKDESPDVVDDEDTSEEPCDELAVDDPSGIIHGGICWGDDVKETLANFVRNFPLAITAISQANAVKYPKYSINVPTIAYLYDFMYADKEDSLKGLFRACDAAIAKTKEDNQDWAEGRIVNLRRLKKYLIKYHNLGKEEKSNA